MLVTRIKMVGNAGFEPTIFRSQSERHTTWLIPHMGCYTGIDPVLTGSQPVL